MTLFPRPARRRAFGTVLAALPMLSLVAGLQGCTHAVGSTSAAGSLAPAPGYLIAAFDRTGSTENDDTRAETMKQVWGLADAAHENDGVAEFWALDNNPLPVRGANVPPDSDDENFQDLMKMQLGPHGNDRQRDMKAYRVARPGRLLRKINAELAARPGKPAGALCLYVATDGDAEDAADLPVFRAEAARLCRSCPHLHVVVSGLRPANNERWRSAFAALGDAYQVYAPGEGDRALECCKAVLYGS